MKLRSSGKTKRGLIALLALVILGVPFPAGAVAQDPLPGTEEPGDTGTEGSVLPEEATREGETPVPPVPEDPASEEDGEVPVAPEDGIVEPPATTEEEPTPEEEADSDAENEDALVPLLACSGLIVVGFAWGYLRNKV